MKIFDSGILFTYKEADKTTKVQCGSFENRDIAFKRIYAMWTARAPEEVWKANNSVASSGGPADAEAETKSN